MHTTHPVCIPLRCVFHCSSWAITQLQTCKYRQWILMKSMSLPGLGLKRTCCFASTAADSVVCTVAWTTGYFFQSGHNIPVPYISQLEAPVTLLDTSHPQNLGIIIHYHCYTTANTHMTTKLTCLSWPAWVLSPDCQQFEMQTVPKNIRIICLDDDWDSKQENRPPAHLFISCLIPACTLRGFLCSTHYSPPLPRGLETMNVMICWIQPMQTGTGSLIT